MDLNSACENHSKWLVYETRKFSAVWFRTGIISFFGVGGNGWNSCLMFQGHICIPFTHRETGALDLLSYLTQNPWNGKYKWPCIYYFPLLLSFKNFWQLIFFNIEIILKLLKSYKKTKESSFILLTQFPHMSEFYITKEHSSKQRH